MSYKIGHDKRSKPASMPPESARAAGFIAEVGMAEINRPDEAAMARILTRHQADQAGSVVRLAWQLGLQREEIANLTWEQLSFPDGAVRLTDREVPMGADIRDYLLRLREAHRDALPERVIARAPGKTVALTAVSRLARRALDEEGMTHVRLADLRQDYIIRQLQTHDYSYVARITGLEIRTLQQNFSPYAPDRSGRAKAEGKAAIDEYLLWKILQEKKDTAVGLALWLAWDSGLEPGEIAALIWPQVDFARDTLCLPRREVPLSHTVRRILQAHHARRTDDPHVLLTEQSRTPMDLARLSRDTRTALIRGGMEHITLQDLQRASRKRPQETAILDAARAAGCVDRNGIARQLGLSPHAAYTTLRALAQTGRLVRIGTRYYLPDAVVPPEQHRACVLDFVAREGMASRQDIAALLHIEPRQCSFLLKQMADAGVLRKEKNYYFLPDPAGKETEGKN